MHLFFCWKRCYASLVLGGGVVMHLTITTEFHIGAAPIHSKLILCRRPARRSRQSKGVAEK